jgi:hypothetical protein
MILEKFVKQPAEVKDFDINYSEWLLPIGDTLQGVTATVACVSTPTNTSLVVNSTSNTTSSVKFWVSGGTAGERYKLTARATTVGGRLDESELLFVIKEF